MKTYTRKRILPEDFREPKRRRIECELDTNDVPPQTLLDSTVDTTAYEDFSSSSPQRDSQVFSDDKQCDATPPSSPPTKLQLHRIVSRQPLFAFLKRKKITAIPKSKHLAERSVNVQTVATNGRKVRLAQTQIDLGGNVQITCKSCRMEYTPSSEEDVSLHKKFHSMNTGGIDISKSALEHLKRNRVWSDGSGGWVASVCGSDPPSVREKTSKILEVVNTELLAVEIRNHELWEGWPHTTAGSRKGRPGKTGAESKLALSTGSKTGRYKVFLYVQGYKCVGLCLAERLSKAKRVLARENEDENTEQTQSTNSSSISVGEEHAEAKMGISRIWTSKTRRRKGIAGSMLDCAADNFLYGIKIPRSLVAFSQPTEGGARLARKWFGAESGWLVYVDHDPS